MNSNDGLDHLTVWVKELSGLFAQVNNLSDIEDFLGALAETATRLTASDGAMVLLMDDSESLRSAAAFGVSKEYADNVTNPSMFAATPLHANIRAAWESGRPVLVSDIETDKALEHWVPIAAREGIRSVGHFPMRSLGQSYGALNIYRHSPHKFDAAEVDLISTLADAATVAVRISAWASEQASQVEKLRAISAARDREARLNTLLLQTVLAENGFDDIAKSLEGELDGHVVIEDSTGCLLSSFRRNDDQHSLRTLYEGIQAYVPSGTKVGDSSAIESVDGRDLYLKEVTLGTHCVAKIWAQASANDKGIPVQRVLDFGAIAVALAMLGSTVEQRDRQSSMNELLDSLVHDHGPETLPAILERATYLGLDLSERQFMLIALPSASVPELKMFESVAQCQRIVADIQNPLVGIVERSVCILLSRSQVSAAKEDIIAKRLASELLRGWRLVVIGEVQVAEVATSVRLGNSLARLGLSGGLEKRVIDARRLGVTGLLFQVSDAESLIAVRDRTIGPLLAYDREHRTQLIGTLRCYLDNNLRANETARGLHIHLNTLRYRLRRIEEILQIEIHSPTDLVNVHFGSQVQDVLESGVISN